MCRQNFPARKIRPKRKKSEFNFIEKAGDRSAIPSNEIALEYSLQLPVLQNDFILIFAVFSLQILSYN